MEATTRRRRAHIDWLRGVAVVIMILAHTMDAWTREDDRTSHLYGWVVKVAGMAAPLFLFLAGVSVALSAARRVRRGATVAQAAAAGRRRGWEVLALAFLFRVQAWVLSPGGAVAGLLKVDILNIMGPAMAVAATVWGISERVWLRVVLLAAAASGFSLLAPVVRTLPALAVLPDWLEWYLRPPRGQRWFALFPWAGLLVAGTVVGELVDRYQRDERTERLLAAGLALGGTLLFLVSLAGSFLPSLYATSSFWTTSPSYFFLRVGLMAVLLSVAWAWCAARSVGRFSPMLQFGRTSLFVYWIHVELAYGLVSYPLHRALPIGWAFAAFAAFTALMLWASLVKDRAVARGRARPGARLTLEGGAALDDGSAATRSAV